MDDIQKLITEEAKKLDLFPERLSPKAIELMRNCFKRGYAEGKGVIVDASNHPQKEERPISLFYELVEALWDVWQYAEKSGKYEFQRKEIKHLLKTDNVIARFGDWILFGGLLYRPEDKKGWYGFNKERTRDFFAGKYAIPTMLYKNNSTGVIRKDESTISTIDKIPFLGDFLDMHGEYIYSHYKEPQNPLFQNQL